MTDDTTIATARARYPWLSDDWEAAVRLELSGSKRTAEKCRANLVRLRDVEEVKESEG